MVSQESQCVSGGAQVTFSVCPAEQTGEPSPTESPSPTQPTPPTQTPLTVTVTHKRKPTTPLELLEDALEKQGLLVHKKDDFLSLGPQQKDHKIGGVIPTAPFDADMKVADRDMYAPLLAHYPTRGFFLRLSKLLVFGMWMKTDCEERCWVVDGELVEQETARDPSGRSRDDYTSKSRDSNVPGSHDPPLLLRYKSAGECEYLADRLERLTNHAWKLFEFEYEGQRPDAVCVYVERHDTWVEQVAMGYDGEAVRGLNCTT